MRKIFGILFIFTSVILLTGCEKQKQKLSEINWDEIELKEKMFKPEILTGEIGTNRSDLVSFDIQKITKSDYKKYVQSYIDAGYNIDLEDKFWDNVYGAFNNEGYSIRIIYSESSEEMNVTFKIPESSMMTEIEWPTTGLGSMVPKPESTLGKISWNNSESFIVHIGNTTIEQFKEYIKKCENLGYTNDYSRSDNYYGAKNSNNYELHLMYLGGNVIEISLSAPEGLENSSGTESSSGTENSSEMRDEFKKAMDDYEKFIDEYVTFMKKYYSSNGSDLSLISEYTKMLNKYLELSTSFSEWNNKDLNATELAYYLEVQTRVNQKILEITN